MHCSPTTNEDCDILLSYSYQHTVDKFLIIEKKDTTLSLSGELYSLPESQIIDSEGYREDIRGVQAVLGSEQIAYTVYDDETPMGLIRGHIVMKQGVPRLDIDGTLVAPEFRGRRAGEALIETMMNHAKNIQCSGLMKELDTQKYAACRLYQKMGFTLAGILTRVWEYPEPYLGSKEILWWRYGL